MCSCHASSETRSSLSSCADSSTLPAAAASLCHISVGMCHLLNQARRICHVPVFPVVFILPPAQLSLLCRLFPTPGPITFWNEFAWPSLSCNKCYITQELHQGSGLTHMPLSAMLNNASQAKLAIRH